MYFIGVWALNSEERKMVDVLEMGCLRSVHHVRKVDRIRNGIVRAR